MEESDESTGYSTIFDDYVLLQQTDWDHLLNKKVKIDSQKELDNNDIKTHVNEAKDKMMDQLEKQTCTVKLMMDESLGSHINISAEEVSEFHFGRSGQSVDILCNKMFHFYQIMIFFHLSYAHTFC